MLECYIDGTLASAKKAEDVQKNEPEKTGKL